MNKKKKKILENALYVLIFAVVFVALLLAGRFKAFGEFVSSVEYRTFDIRQNWTVPSRQARGDIVIIAIDDPSYEYIMDNFGTWPLSRGYWANLINKLQPVNPKFIVFDLLFTKKMGAMDDGDRALVEAVKNNKNVYLSMNFDNYPSQMRTPPELPDYLKVAVSNGNIIKNSPYLAFANCRKAMDELLYSTPNFGFINVTREKDGIIRHMSPAFYYRDNFYNNLTLLVALRHIGANPNKLSVNQKNELILDSTHKIPLTMDGRAIINWYGKEGTYEHIGLWQVDKAIKNNDIDFLKQKFENKTVYIGTTVTALADIKSTPVSFMYPGVETHTTFLNNILDNNFITKCDLKIDILISLLLCVLIATYVLKINSVLKSTISSFFTLLAYILITVFLMEKFDLWVGIVLPVFAAVVMFIASYIAKYLIMSRDYEHTYKLAVTDGLTEMYNHRYFQEQMIANTNNVSRYGGTFSLILVDIDFFKKFNDKHGHQSGDAVLRQVAQTIKKNIRNSDLACRYGGEEMSVILPNTKKEDAVVVAKKIWSAIRERKFELADGNWENVTISVGVASMPKDGKTPEELIEYSDKCLYRAKQNGRDQVVSEIEA